MVSLLSARWYEHTCNVQVKRGPTRTLQSAAFSYVGTSTPELYNWKEDTQGRYGQRSRDGCTRTPVLYIGKEDQGTSWFSTPGIPAVTCDAATSHIELILCFRRNVFTVEGCPCRNRWLQRRRHVKMSLGTEVQNIAMLTRKTSVLVQRGRDEDEAIFDVLSLRDVNLHTTLMLRSACVRHGESRSAWTTVEPDWLYSL